MPAPRIIENVGHRDDAGVPRMHGLPLRIRGSIVIRSRLSCASALGRRRPDLRDRQVGHARLHLHDADWMPLGLSST